MKWAEREAFLEHLKQLEDDGKNDLVEYEVKRHCLYISDRVSGGMGGAHVEEDENEQGTFNFSITLGPANARRLVDFLQTLPDEPEEDDEDDDIKRAVGGA